MSTIQNYLNDTTIPIEKRKLAIDMAKTSPEKVESLINQKYGSKYQTTIGDVMPSTGIAQSVPAMSIAPQSPAQENLAKAMMKKGTPSADISSKLGELQENPGLSQRTSDIYKGQIESSRQIRAEGREKLFSGEPIEGRVKEFTADVKAGLAPVTSVVGAALQPAVEGGIELGKDLLKKGLIATLGEEEGNVIYDNIGQNTQEVIAKTVEAYDNLPSNQKTGVQFAGAIAEIMATLVGGRGAVKGVEETLALSRKGLKAGEEALDVARKNIKNASIVRAEQAIEEGLEKGIKPSLTGSKKTLSGMEKWKQDARQAVDTIIENENNLKLVDEFGEGVEGLPQNLKQFSDSIDQTKKGIFKQYDELAKEATGKGSKLDLKDVGSELDKVVKNKVLQTERPEIVKYAKEKIKRYSKVSYSPDEAQEAIKILNQSLESFYRNPSYDSASKAYIDALVVNNMRKNLDELITNATGSEYQALRNQYAALKSIEKDVVHRTLVDAKKSSKGLIDFTDIFSGGEAVAGILSLNPSLLAKAATQKAIKEWFKFMNDPNTIIKNMFQKAKSVK